MSRFSIGSRAILSISISHATPSPHHTVPRSPRPLPFPKSSRKFSSGKPINSNILKIDTRLIRLPSHRQSSMECRLRVFSEPFLLARAVGFCRLLSFSQPDKRQRNRGLFHEAYHGSMSEALFDSFLPRPYRFCSSSRLVSSCMNNPLLPVAGARLSSTKSRCSRGFLSLTRSS